jgi:FG-GAP repeat
MRPTRRQSGVASRSASKRVLFISLARAKERSLMNPRYLLVFVAVALYWDSCAVFAAVPTHRTLVASDGTFGPLGPSFGMSVATDGRTILVGNPQFGTPGSAYLFDALTGAQLAKFVPPTTGINGLFGDWVSVEGAKAVVGSHAGAYLFDFSNLSHITRSELTPTGTTDHLFGPVDISGNKIIAAGETGDLGDAFLFDATTGAQLAMLRSSDRKVSDGFGIAVAIDGNTAVVGAPSAAGFGGQPLGAVYQFDAGPGAAIRAESARYIVPNQTISRVGANDFGYSLDLNGTKILAGEAHSNSYLWDIGGTPNVLPQSTWLHSFNNFLSLDSQLAVVGFYGQDSPDRSESVRVYRSSSGEFLTRFVGDNPTGIEGFGIAAAVANGIVVVGAPGADSAHGGSAYVYYVPEPSSMGLAVGACALVWWQRKRLKF